MRRRHVVAIALALGASVLLRPATAGAVTAEEVVRKHLAWQEATKNYRAEITQLGLVSGKLGTVFVDNGTNPPTVYFEGELQFEKERRPLEIVGTRNATTAAIGARASQWTLPTGPFGRSFELFTRDGGVEETLKRMDVSTSTIEVLENPVGGLVGLRMTFDPGFLGTMDGILEKLLLGGSVPRDLQTTIWFNGEGRIERMVLDEGESDMIITVLNYLEVNMPEARTAEYRKTIDVGTKSKVYPSLAEMVLDIMGEDKAKNATP